MTPKPLLIPSLQIQAYSSVLLHRQPLVEHLIRYSSILGGIHRQEPLLQSRPQPNADIQIFEHIIDIVQTERNEIGPVGVLASRTLLHPCEFGDGVFFLLFWGGQLQSTFQHRDRPQGSNLKARRTEPTTVSNIRLRCTHETGPVGSGLTVRNCSQ